jgi:hypothetical protein
MSRDQNPWHTHPTSHQVGGNLGRPDPPKVAFPGSSYRKGVSGNPAASDHSHPLDLGIRVNTTGVNPGASFSIQGTSWSAWGIPLFNFTHKVRDVSCGLLFRYDTSWYAVQNAAGIQYGIWYNGVTYFDDRVRHFKNNPGDHTLASGTIAIAAGVIPEGIQSFFLMWRLYYGMGSAWASADYNDFAQVTVTENYVAP